MPNIRSQEIDRDGIRIVTSNGRVFSIDRAELVRRFNLMGGNRRRLDLQDLVIQLMEQVVGKENVSVELTNLELEEDIQRNVNGKVKRLEFFELVKE